MSASSSPVLTPMAASPSARFTAVVDLPTPPLPDATAMMDSTPGMPAGDGAARPPDAAPWRGGGALASQRDQHRDDARQRAHRGFGAFAHRLPLLDRCGVDRDGEKHLAIG